MKILSLLSLACLGANILTHAAGSRVNETQTVAPNVYFHEGNIALGHCNNGWIVFADYVLVIDANFPSGANEVIPKIKAITDKPIRFAFDTHHHGDHAYGNQVWADQGAVPVAHTGVIDEMKKYETALFGGKPGRWEDTARTRPDVRNSKLKAPTLLFPKELFFDDGANRVELRHFGVAHTHGDGFAWLPKEKILFTGDACVNGAFNFVGDGNIGEWIKTLEQVQKLGATTVCPGHGPVGTAQVLEDQKQFFITLRAQAQQLLTAKKSAAEINAAVEGLKAEIQKNEQIARYVGGSFPAQLEKAYVELGGKPFIEKRAAVENQRQQAGARSLGASAPANAHALKKPRRSNRPSQ